ncbi:MAG TPA: methionine aminotransferase [Cytophagaceae bacterium]|jgi:methionine aminotransferase|nr:methionine aminotransferase [Cytophagaceae bacterium]
MSSVDLHLSKLPHTGTNIFTTMSGLAVEHNAVNLAQGFPDFDVPSYLIDRMMHHMQSGKNQYAPMPGILSLREKLSIKYASVYGIDFDPADEITITCGATEACFSVITAMIKTGDEVIIIEPAFDCYEPAILLNGGNPVFVKTTYPDFKINWNKIEEAITPQTRLLILNSPHNPTGTIFTKDDVVALRELLHRYHQVFVLSDEVYEHMVFDGEHHHCLAADEFIKNRTFTVGSFGKTYHATGWRLGFCAAPKYLTKEFRKVHQFNTFSAVTPIQHAVSDMLDDTDWHHNLSSFFQSKRNYFLNAIKHSKFKGIPTQGTYFQLLSYAAVSDKTEIEMANWLVKEMKLAAIPISVFYRDKTEQQILRFCFAKKEETLEQAAEILCKI